MTWEWNERIFAYLYGLTGFVGSFDRVSEEEQAQVLRT
jgi:hypothetical protein